MTAILEVNLGIGNKNLDENFCKVATIIQERSKSLYSKSLVLDYSPAADHQFPFYYISEINRFVGVFPVRGKMLFAIKVCLYDQGENKKEIRCRIFDENILEIAREELKKMSKIFPNTTIYLEKKID